MHIKGNYYARGKLLLTGEYGVLDGAKAIALPTKFGQHFSCKPTKSSDLIWQSKDHNGDVWFTAQISLYDFSAVKTSDEKKAAQLGKLLKNAVRLNSEFLSKWNGFKVETKLDFPLDWGLGSSSTLSYLVAMWADVHPILLHFKTYAGSGYDVACAGADGPIEYQLSGDSVSYSEIDFEPSFLDKLYFVHLGKKQNSNDAIREYSKTVKDKKTLANKLTKISEEIMDVKSFSKFCELLDTHENILSKALGKQKVKDIHFPDFAGSIKSLGAWGGDFVLACSNAGHEKVNNYFQTKGYSTVVAYEEMIHASHEKVSV